MPPLDSGPLPAISDELPAGENLELDPEFSAMERAAQEKKEVQYGNTIEPAVPPDWRETASLAESLLKRTHDLRVLVKLAIARLHLGGMSAFAQVIVMIRQELELNWAHVHPQLDPEDDNDPMQRANALMLLRDPSFVLRTLRDMTLAGNQRIGRVAFRDIAVLNGTMEPDPNRPKLTASDVQGLFRDSDKAQIATVRDAIETTLAELKEIVAVFDREAGPGNAPSFDDETEPGRSLLKLLRDMHREVTKYQVTDEAPPAADEAPAAESGGDAPAESATPRASGRSFASIMAISGLGKREEALHALELAASYYRTHEPSSPLPLLIDRARRLAGMDFMDILRDLAPDGLSQAQLVAGATNE